ncbi:hypothetical protein NUU61_007801 [Penicillium alfredii]|uniref:Uncharacterized protein n=1 Tax=Penicillium alfredii TaxID=1506179 RepID=A0A9W9ERC3_9EURO|nr:uncharacterized protein NUU61_007801 [Penicillium alfredii]KAJ5086494.1 hypothetical protein NUU61_007801 [Penicillium alfredii]
MAIWPFGRKNKRHTIQVSPDEAATLQSSLEEQDPQEPDIEPTLGRKLSRRQSKRHSVARPDGTDSIRGSARAPSHRPISSLDARNSDAGYDRVERDNLQSLPRNEPLYEHQPPPRPVSRTGSVLRRKPTQNGPNKLKKSKRRTDEAMREREIRMLSSTPIDIPRRSFPAGGDYGMEQRRRKANRYLSDVSLSIRDSAASSISDASDPYTFKVNAFAALTPRPVVRYVEAPRLPTAKSQNAPSTREQKERLQAMTMSQEELYYSKRRVNELADSLDAGSLRELLERDRRRREKKQIDDQEKLRRKLQERADAQRVEEEQRAAEEAAAAAPAIAVAETQDEASRKDDSASAAAAPEQSGSWLRGASKGSEVTRRESVESSRDPSVRDQRLAARPSFAQSHEMGMSRTTLSPHSSVRHGLSSPSQSQNFGLGSTSDISRTVDSERRPSDTSGRRGNAISSLFRRGSSRLKRRYRERFQDTSPEVSNASHESFYKIQTQSSPPPAVVPPPRTFVAIGTVKRSQSKFTEHFGDEPLSPSESRLQSPIIPEQVPESSMENEEEKHEMSSLNEPAPSAGIDIKNPRRDRHQSWTAESFDAESDNVPLSQSLASIDSEGSWMSGQFFRRMSQKPSSPVRANIDSLGPMPTDGPADTPDDIQESVDSRRPSSQMMGEPELDNDLAGADASKPAETWHSEVGRRPILVNPIVRPKSTQGMLKTSLSPISAEDDFSPEEEPIPIALQRVPSAKAEIGHVETDGFI